MTDPQKLSVVGLYWILVFLSTCWLFRNNSPHVVELVFVLVSVGIVLTLLCSAMKGPKPM
jgi:hypothetical protein